MPCRSRSVCGLLAATVCLLLVVVPAGTSARVRNAAKQAAVPPGFVGMVVDGPLWPDASPGLDLATQLDGMVATGVQTLRITFDWGSIQPYKNDAAVPAADKAEFTDVGGVPTEWTDLDQVVGLAAQRGLTILPMVLYAPEWDGFSDDRSLVERPKRVGPYANFVKALVQRYGPHGTFWPEPGDHEAADPHVADLERAEHPGVLVAAADLRELLRGAAEAAHAAIKSADPGAKVVLAGFPNFSWVALQRIYDVRGARTLFDVVAVHPYTKEPQGVITILDQGPPGDERRGRQRKPMIADEISWPSSLGKTPHNNGFDFATTEAGQARNIATLLPLLGRDRRSLNLAGFYYYTWVGRRTAATRRRSTSRACCVTRRARSRAKPALAAFTNGALALERLPPEGRRRDPLLQAGLGHRSAERDRRAGRGRLR